MGGQAGKQAASQPSTQSDTIRHPHSILAISNGFKKFAKLGLKFDFNMDSKCKDF